MELTTVFKKGINRILIELFIQRKRKHTDFVELNIGNLNNYHTKNIEYDFTPVRKKLLGDILTYARKNCNYYKNILPEINSINAINDAAFQNIPVLTKDLIRKNEQDLKSNIVPEDCFRQVKTSGSTGNPLSFWTSGNTDPVHQQFLFELYGYKPGDKILAMDGTLLEDYLTENEIFWKIKNDGNMLPYGGMALSALFLNKKTIQKYIDFILSYKPDFIRGYPAFITEIAQYIISNKIPVDFQLKGIELTSELVSDGQVKTIAQAFHCKVFGQYGHKEACVFGYTIDDSFAYYCSPLYGITEVLDENDKQVGIGEEGEIIVTNFSNFAMPFIRYRTGDRAIYGGEENGIVKLNQVLGRTSNYVFNESGEKKLITSFNFGQRCNAISKIAQWQIVQNTIGEVTVNIQRLNGFSKKDEDEICQIFRGAGITKCDIINNEAFIKTTAGKVKFVIQNIKSLPAWSIILYTNSMLADYVSVISV